MKKYPLIGISIVAVVFLIVASLSNVVGFQTVQSSNQKMINDDVDQKELLFQTIVDITNNKDIQKIVLQKQISTTGFLTSGWTVVSRIPALTKNQLNRMYLVGVALSKMVSKSRIHSMVKNYQVRNQRMQKEIAAVIEKNSTLNTEMAQLLTLKCDCGNNITTVWGFPVLCMTLAILGMITYVLAIITGYFLSLFAIIYSMMGTLNC